ncbi:hypothetical protein RUM43_011253 [Polyplax serrata]|uniref:Ig-like domain-containing protein n=1 Tax=Polyplax serrata TaxID=468196 RepID=A0AAN8NSR6_POLSC
MLLARQAHILHFVFIWDDDKVFIMFTPGSKGGSKATGWFHFENNHQVSENVYSALNHALRLLQHGNCEDNTVGPVLIKEPPNRVDFSNTTGAEVECTARGNPPPEIIWVRSDGTAVGDVPGLRQVAVSFRHPSIDSHHPDLGVLPNGNLVFPPFRAEDYRQEVHAQVYVCLAKNSVGSIHSRDVNVRAVVSQFYDTDVNKEYVIRGNSAIVKCQLPSFVADFLTVVSWHSDQGDDIYPGGDYVVKQFYESEVNNEYVIRGNSAVLKCSIPSFVADFVSVISWQDDSANSYSSKDSYVVNQYYEAEVVSEYVIRGNTAVLKCNIPSFVADFVRVEAWVGSDSNVYLPKQDYVVNQFYKAEILTEYVIRGNTAVLKCSIPSFVADYVVVEAWIDENGKELVASDHDYVVNQFYTAEILKEYVIRGNTAILKCNIPSFVADYVTVGGWLIDDSLEIGPTKDDYGNPSRVFAFRPSHNCLFQDICHHCAEERAVNYLSQSFASSAHIPGPEKNRLSISVTLVSQYYVTEAENEYVIHGNSAVMKCKIPSFVADFVSVISWVSDSGETYVHSSNVNYVVTQPYEAEADNEYVIRGNSAIMKCEVPSFVADFVTVEMWTDTEGNTYYQNSDYVVQQFYQSRVSDEFVLRGNTAILKCQVPSFVADFIEVVAWVSDEGDTFLKDSSYLQKDAYHADNRSLSSIRVVTQRYEVNVMDEYVLRGNSAIIKCHIPSFVADYVYVSDWVEDGNQVITPLLTDADYGTRDFIVLISQSQVIHPRLNHPPAP